MTMRGEALEVMDLIYLFGIALGVEHGFGRLPLFFLVMSVYFHRALCKYPKRLIVGNGIAG